MVTLLIIELFTTAVVLSVIALVYALCTGRVVELFQYLGLAPEEEE